MSFNLGNALKSLAPTLATMLGGPLAGSAVAALEGVFGLSPGSGADAVADVLQKGSLTPEMIEKLKECELQQATIMAQQKIDLVKLNLDHDAAIASTDVADRSSARAMQVATKDWTPDILAWLIMAGSGFVAYLVLCGNLTKDPALATMQGTVIGYLFNEAKTVLAYFFGSSAGSKEKDATIADIARS